MEAINRLFGERRFQIRGEKAFLKFGGEPFLRAPACRAGENPAQGNSAAHTAEKKAEGRRE
jgi:hypothetical protein